MKRIGLVVCSLLFFLFLLPSLKPTQAACLDGCCQCAGSYCLAWEYCSKTCSCGCNVSCSGGSCITCPTKAPTAAPTSPPTSHCDTIWNNPDICPCGCQPSITGGGCKSCCNITCACGCTPDQDGGTCKACPPTATPTKSPCVAAGHYCSPEGCDPTTEQSYNLSCGSGLYQCCGPKCVPSCACAVNTCVGTQCSNGCGGVCAGIKTVGCSSTCTHDFNSCTPGIGSTCCSGYCPGGTCLPMPAKSPTPTPSCGGAGQRCCTTGSQCTSSLYTCYQNTCVRATCASQTTCTDGRIVHCIDCSGPGGTCGTYSDPYTDYDRICGLGCDPSRPWDCLDGTVGSYCETTACDSCGGDSTKKVLTCWSSYLSFKAGETGTKSCVAKGTSCELVCSPLTVTCGGAAVCTPPLVSHVDNCGGLNCAPDTDCGGSGGGCTPDCTGADAACQGTWIDAANGCGQCAGTKICGGTVTARAVTVGASDTSCATITTATTLLDGSAFSFTPRVSPVWQTQEGGDVVWTGVSTDGTTVYTITSVPPTSQTIGNVCVSQDGGTYSQSSSGTLTSDGTLQFVVGFIPKSGWVQSTTGDVYASAQLISSIPTTATYPYMSLVSGGGSPGIVSYGVSYDFSLTTSDKGESQVSSPGWLAQQTNTTVPFYERIKHKLDVPTSATVLESPIVDSTKPSCSTNPCIYYANGDMTTAASSPWTIGATEKMIFVVNGNLTINSPITITPGGFFAAIVNGNIVIADAVGGIATDTTPHIEGLYVATNDAHTATFTGGTGGLRLNVFGSVIADEFNLGRDLGVANDTTPGESFTLNPQLLFTMPEAMKETPYIWQEVAP